MKNFKKIALALSLTIAIGIGSFAYASDFSAPENKSESYKSEENFGGHCFEKSNGDRRHNEMRNHRNHRRHRDNRNHKHHRHNEKRHRR